MNAVDGCLVPNPTVQSQESGLALIVKQKIEIRNLEEIAKYITFII